MYKLYYELLLSSAFMDVYKKFSALYLLTQQKWECSIIGKKKKKRLQAYNFSRKFNFFGRSFLWFNLHEIKMSKSKGMKINPAT